MNSLGLDIDSFVGPGRKAAKLEVVVLRPIEPEDLEALAANRSTQPVAVERITERHHALARALASGLGEGEAAFSTGYTPAHVSVLKTSPAFRELLDLYREKSDREFVDTAARLAGLTHDAVVELQSRLENDPESLSPGTLIDIAKMGADRSGLGPTQRTEQVVTVNLAERIDAARRRAAVVKRVPSFSSTLDISPAVPNLIEDAEVLPAKEA